MSGEIGLIYLKKDNVMRNKDNIVSLEVERKGGCIVKYLTDVEWQRYRDKYNCENNSYEKSMIFRVGIEAGLYSELVGVMECMLYCHIHHMKFILYSQDANFSNGNGWEEFFEPFCEKNQDILNKFVNRRYYYTGMRKWLFEIPDRILSGILKKRNKIDYLTKDFFTEFTSRKFWESDLKWELFDMDGTVYPEIHKIRMFTLRYNKPTYKEINELIMSIKLPEEYISIQIRGGDKISEYKKLYNANDCMEIMENSGIEIKNLFIFTDDYRNVEIIKERHKDWNVYTLTHQNEQGYNNDVFQKQSWDVKRRNLIKLFAMVEICIESKLHFGCEQASVDNIIRPAKEGNYISLMDARKDQR